MDSIKAISVFDGRYRRYTKELNEIFSEYGLIKHRVFVEIQWLKFLFEELGFETVSKEEIRQIDTIVSNFNADAAVQIKDIEKETNHDVKAVEYFIKDKLTEMGMAHLKEWVHFACTSDDINNTSYALIVKEGRGKLVGNLTLVIEKIESYAKEYKGVPMMSRTHGQPATPTTAGKELVNFAWRLRIELTNLKLLYVHAKMNGASGNFNAHHFVFPETNWIEASEKFISQYLGLTPILYTTQINPNNYLSEILHNLIRIASTIIDLDRDMWGYISLGYFKQKTIPGEVGSSTMPHKVNPIDFENSEGNMGMAIPIMEHLAVKLLNSRFQRDLTDSTVLRNLGAVWGYLLIGLNSTIKGLSKIAINKEALENDLKANPELLAEAIQTAMRIFKEENPYEKLKNLTRGRRISADDISQFVDDLEKVPEELKQRMKKLTVDRYTGLAEKLVDHYFSKI
ncbi:MAG: adenylosuccinate lyase [Desulfobacteraceae bacterium]|jgi:adenylosuccinate lyase|nr:adenylosuccinate lyase [Desulfobacteraceae bacterium]